MTATPQFVEIDETTFHDTYRPKTNGGDLLQYDDVRDAALNHVWTIVEGEEPEPAEEESDDDEPRPSEASWYAVPGFHIVNKLGYVLTEVPWPHENLQAVYFDGSDAG